MGRAGRFFAQAGSGGSQIYYGGMGFPKRWRVFFPPGARFESTGPSPRVPSAYGLGAISALSGPFRGRLAAIALARSLS